jgi:hypothetical protein
VGVSLTYDTCPVGSSEGGGNGGGGGGGSGVGRAGGPALKVSSELDKLKQSRCDKRRRWNQQDVRENYG